MSKAHILNIQKTKYVLIISIIITFFLIHIIITEAKPNQSVVEFKSILSILIPAMLGMLSIFVSGMAIMIGTLRVDLIKNLSEENKRNVKTVINTFSYASKTSAVLFIMMLVAYILLSINYSLGFSPYIIIVAVYGFVIVYTLLFLIQFTVYLVGMIIRIYEISLFN